MDGTEETKEAPGRGRKRLLLIPATFAAGAVAAAGVIAGFGVGDSSEPAGSAANAAIVATSTSIAKTTTSLDAATIYKQDSAGVVDISVTESASAGSGLPVLPGRLAAGDGRGNGLRLRQQRPHHHRRPRRQRRLEDHRPLQGRLDRDGDARRDRPSTDTAVIKVSVPASKLTPLTLANSSTVEPGEGVVAIGSPFGYTESITAGIVSAVNRTIQAPNGYSISNTIQTDAPINHGNSGGPLIDGSGKVIGTNVQIAVDDQSSGSVNAGVGFAVPSDTVKTVVDSLIAGKAVQHAYLGVSVGNASTGSGAQVGTVRSGGPAATAGLKQGDVVTAIDGKAIADANALTAAVGAHQPGDTIKVTVKRDGSTVQVTVKLGTRPASTTA